MGYSANAPLEALFAVGPAERAAERMTERTLDMISEKAKDKSPVAEPPAGAVNLGEVDEWLASRGRTPGSLKESWYETPVEREGPEKYAGFSQTDDPVAPFVEWDTSPHVIVPVNALALRFWDNVGKVFRQGVFHPGTRGQHMMRDALFEAEVEWVRVGEEEVARWATEQARLVI